MEVEYIFWVSDIGSISQHIFQVFDRQGDQQPRQWLIMQGLIVMLSLVPEWIGLINVDGLIRWRWASSYEAKVTSLGPLIFFSWRSSCSTIIFFFHKALEIIIIIIIIIQELAQVGVVCICFISNLWNHTFNSLARLIAHKFIGVYEFVR